MKAEYDMAYLDWIKLQWYAEVGIQTCYQSTILRNTPAGRSSRRILPTLCPYHSAIDPS